MPFPIVGRKVSVADASVSPAVVFAGAKSKSIDINNEPIDTTNDDDDGFRSILSDPATRSIEISMEGLAKDTTLLVQATAASPTLIKALEITFEGVGVIAGDFYAANLSLGAPHNDQTTFSVKLMSTGAFTFTAV